MNIGIKKIKPKRTQLHFRDDGQFQFRKLDILDGFLVEKEQELVVKAWLLFYKLQKRFKGYKKIGSDMVTVSYDRDIVLDTFGQLKDAEKPEKGANLKKDFVSKIATAKCYKHEHGGKKKTLMDKMVMFFGIAMVGEIVIMLIQVAVKQGG
jgi:hypothetical protein